LNDTAIASDVVGKQAVLLLMRYAEASISLKPVFLEG
jgi:hypothetical protein